MRDATVKNFTAEVNIEGGEQIGGIANYAYPSNSSVIIQDVVVKGIINGTSQVGGIVGRGYADYGNGGYKYPVYIEGCTNEAEISGSSDFVGGIIGYYFTDNYIKDSANMGNITRGGVSTGGIAGYAVYGRFENCSNSGMILGNESTGGIVGNVATAEMERANTTFTDCYNIGKVEGESKVGGILGGPTMLSVTADDKTGKTTNYTNCYNEGDITATKNYAGGIAGTTNPAKGSFTSQVYNTGNISGANYVAGLFGSRVNVDSAVNCYNMGIITAKGANAGAISANTNGSTTDCYNMSSSIGNPIDIANIKILEKESFSNGHASYLLDGGMMDVSNSERMSKWSQDFQKGYPILKNNESVYMVTMNSKGNGSIEIAGRGFIEAEDNKAMYFEIKGQRVKLNAVSEKISETEEYKLKSILAEDMNGKEIYRFDGNNNIGNTEHEFTMPGSNITVTAEFELQEKVNITPQITGFSDGAAIAIGNSENGVPYIASMGDTVNVSVNILSHPSVEGATSAEYYLKSIKVEFEDGSTLDITDVRQFTATGNAVVTADIGEKIVFPSIEEPKDEDNDDDDKEVIGGGTGNGTGDGTGSGIGEGTGGGTDTGQDGNKAVTPDTGSTAPVDNNTEGKDKNTTPAVNTSQQPKEKEATVVEAEPDEEVEAEPEQTQPQPEEPEEEVEEASTAPSANEQRSMIPPIAAVVVAALLILVGIYRFIILKKKK